VTEPHRVKPAAERTVADLAPEVRALYTVSRNPPAESALAIGQRYRWRCNVNRSHGSTWTTATKVTKFLAGAAEWSYCARCSGLVMPVQGKQPSLREVAPRTADAWDAQWAAMGAPYLPSDRLSPRSPHILDNVILPGLRQPNLKAGAPNVRRWAELEASLDEVIASGMPGAVTSMELDWLNAKARQNRARHVTALIDAGLDAGLVDADHNAVVLSYGHAFPLIVLNGYRIAVYVDSQWGVDDEERRKRNTSAAEVNARLAEVGWTAFRLRIGLGVQRVSDHDVVRASFDPAGYRAAVDALTGIRHDQAQPPLF